MTTTGKTTGALVKVGVIEQMLVDSKTVVDFSKTFQTGVALLKLAKTYQFHHEEKNRVARTCLGAARGAGVLLAGGVRRGGSSKSQSETLKGTPKQLPDGISKHTSSRWQALAKLSQKTFNEILEKASASPSAEIVISKVVEFAVHERRRGEREESSNRQLLLPTHQPEAKQ